MLDDKGHRCLPDMTLIPCWHGLNGPKGNFNGHVRLVWLQRRANAACPLGRIIHS